MRFWTISSVEDCSDEATQWYVEERLLPAAKDPRVSRSWLVETVDFHQVTGPSLPKLMAIYESVEVHSQDEIYVPSPDEWRDAEGRISGQRVSVRELLLDFWFPSSGGQWWCSVRADPKNPEVMKEWDEFERWYTFEHVGETVIAPGFHEGWRLGEEVSATSQGTFHQHFRWAMYETDALENMMDHVNKRPLKPIWRKFVNEETFGRSYHSVVKSA